MGTDINGTDINNIIICINGVSLLCGLNLKKM